jgi:hypothetical protein
VTRTANELGTPQRAIRGEELPGSQPLELPGLGLVREGSDPNLTGLMGYLLLRHDERGKTWGQRIVEVWIVEALNGNPRAIVDILDRTEKGPPGRTPDVVAAPSIDDRIASKILEIVCDRGEEATGD